MTTRELARVCAEAIVDDLARQGYLINAPASLPIAHEYVRGCLTHALDEQRLAVQEIVHVHTPGLGAVDVKVTKSTQGVSLEVDCKRPREPDESWDAAAAASARLVAAAYAAALEEIAAIGLVPGKDARP